MATTAVLVEFFSTGWIEINVIVPISFYCISGKHGHIYREKQHNNSEKDSGSTHMEEEDARRKNLEGNADCWTSWPPYCNRNTVPPITYC